MKIVSVVKRWANQYFEKWVAVFTETGEAGLGKRGWTDVKRVMA